MPRKEELSATAQKATFAAAFTTLRHYLATENYIAAYVIAFSILEDRVNSMYATRYLVAYGKPLPTEGVSRKNFTNKIRFLREHNEITAIDLENWAQAAIDRNRKLHAAMWNLDEFGQSDVEQIATCARSADNARKAQKRLFAKT